MNTNEATPASQVDAIVLPPLRDVLHIYVSDDHISAARPNTCNRCPIALAVMEQLPGYEVQVSASASDEGLHIYHDGVGASFNLSETALRFMGNFDSLRDVESQEFIFYRA